MNNSTKELLIGEGRSGKVYLERDSKGRSLAKKTFTGESLGKLVLFILTGSANPYTWCESAIRSAVARRYILKHLVRYWFGSTLRLPDTDSWDWNDKQLAFEIRTELIEGKHAPLPNPFPGSKLDYLRDLVINIMKPLQHHLIESGFDGLVWQAGLGNPVASNNFMLEDSDEEQLKWVWIDLESGVPALFALNPLATIRFYLPRSLRYRRPIFDDVDVPKLHNYLLKNGSDIERSIGKDGFKEITFYLDQLGDNQQRWKSLTRRQRSIAYELSRGRINNLQAERYRSQPIKWNLHLLGIRIPKVPHLLAGSFRRGFIWFRGLDVRQLSKNVWHYLVSTKYRWSISQTYVGRKIDMWIERKFIDQDEADHLRTVLGEEDVSSYLTDFSVHLAIKLPIKIIQWMVMPTLWAIGIIDGTIFALVAIFGGSIGRTIYTLSRVFQSTFQRQRRPWIALFVGAIQGVGTIAYPLQLLYRGSERGGELARFIIYDSLASIGRRVPIWGGKDSQVEHYFVRIGTSTVNWLGYLSQSHYSYKRLLVFALLTSILVLIYMWGKTI